MTDVDVLFVCTGNLCRSPSAAWFFRRWVSELGSGTDHVTVHSGGILGSASPVPIRLLQEGGAFGLDLDDHASRRVSTSSILRANLIVGMTREHVREIVLADTSSFTKTFTLREIARRGREKGPREAGESLEEWLFRLSAGRRHLDLIGDSPEDDTPDPMGGRSEDFRNMLTELESLTKGLHALIWPQG